MLKYGVQVSLVEPGYFSSVTACQTELHFKRYEEEANGMWKNASDEVRKTYTRKYFEYAVALQSVSIGGSATTTTPVIDALEDAVISGMPHAISRGQVDVV